MRYLNDLLADSSTETSSNVPESDHDSESGASKSKKKRRLKHGPHVMRIPEQTSFRRRTMNSQDTPYSYNQFEEDLKPRRNLKRHSMLRLDSPSPSNSDKQANKYQDYSNAVSETQSQKNVSLMPIEHITTTLSESRPLSNNISTIIVTNGDADQLMMEEEEMNPSAVFARKSSELKKKITHLETLLAAYLSGSSVASMSISTLIHECLNYLSVEALSSEELLCYLQNDMGKLLFALSNILEEFERQALGKSITVHTSVILKLICFEVLIFLGALDQAKERKGE